MPRNVQTPDGRTAQFPDDMSNEDIQRVMRQHYPSAQKAPQPSTFQEKIGHLVPQWATGPLATAQKYLVDPFDKMAKAGSDFGAEAMEAGMRAGPLPAPMARSPIAIGMGRAVGETIGGTVADPRNWPLLASSAARPILSKMISYGFAGQMGAGAIQSAKHLYDNWDNLTPQERAESATQSGISALFARGAWLHATASKVVADARVAREAPTTVETQSVETKPGPSYEEIKSRIAALEQTKEIKKEAPVQATPIPAEKITKPAPAPEPPKAPVRDVRDLMAASEAKEAPLTPEQRAADRDRFLSMTKKYGEKGTQPERPSISSTEYARRLKEAGWGPASIIGELRRRYGAAVPTEFQDTRTPFQPDTRESVASNVDALKRGLEESRASKAAGVGKPPINAQVERPADQGPTPGAQAESVQTPGASPRPGEPVRAAEGPKIEPLPPVQRLAGGQTITDPAAMATINRDFERRGLGTPGASQGRRAGDVSSEPRSERGVETLGANEIQLAQNLNLPSTSTRMQLFEAQVKAFEKKGMARGTAEFKARKVMENARGSLSFRPDDDSPAARRARKIDEWIKVLKDKKVTPQASEQAMRMLKAFGLENDDILQRMTGAEGFAEVPGHVPSPPEPYSGLHEDERLKAEWMGWDKQGHHAWTITDPPYSFDRARKILESPEGGSLGSVTPGRRLSTDEAYNLSKIKTWAEFHDLESRLYKAEKASRRVDPRTGIPESSQEGLEERIGPEDRPSFLRLVKRDEALRGPDVGKGMDVKSGEGLEAPAWREAYREGEPGVRGVKDTGLEELERMMKLKDPRSGERGSLSLRPLKEEDRERLSPRLRLANLIDKIFPDKPETELAARATIRDVASQLARKALMMDAKFKERIDAHDNDGKIEFQAFMDAGEGKEGAEFLGKADQPIAEEFHKMFQERWERVKAIKGIDQEGIENYLSHLWKKPSQAKDVIGNIMRSKRPLEGPAGFLKQRFYEYASDGLQAGLEPVTMNPIRMQMAALFQIDRFLSAHDIKDRFKDAGLAKWFSFEGGGMKDRPSTWQKLDDKIFQPEKFEDGGLKQYGVYYAPPEVAKVFNRYLQPGLKGNALYDTARAYGNTLNQIQLGISAYHGTFITLVSSISDVSLGLEKLLNNHDVGGFKNILRGTAGTFLARSAAADYRLGTSIQEEALRPTGNVALQPLVRALERSGARFDIDPFYENAQARGFFKSLKEGKPFEALSTGVQKLSRPIMKYYVPRIKLGMAARMIEAKLEYLKSQGINDELTIANELGKISDSVDNRAGQMVYDNQFWNKMTKDLSFLTVRAVGWDYGSGREFFGALRDTAKQTGKLLKGDQAQLTSRMAFTIATPMVIGMLGGITHYLGTGKAPEKAEDYFYPATGQVDHNGRPERLSWPSYMKDFYAFKAAPVQTLVHKLHPDLQQLGELYQNADFYNTEIRTPGDPLYKQGLEVLKWWGKSSMIPFSLQGIQRRHDAGESWGAAATSFFGVMPAPAGIGQTKAEDLAFTLNSRKWQGAVHTRDERTQKEYFHQLQTKFDQHTLTGKDLNDSLASGHLVPKDLDRLFDEQKMTFLQRNFQGLRLHEALKVMQTADPNERVQLKMQLAEKLDQLDEYGPDDQKQLLKEFKQFQ